MTRRAPSGKLDRPVVGWVLVAGHRPATTHQRRPLMRIRAALCALIATLILATSATAAGVSVHASPTTVQRGHRVHIFGTIPDCGGPLTLLSRAFIHTHDFAGLPA